MIKATVDTVKKYLKDKKKEGFSKLTALMVKKLSFENQHNVTIHKYSFLKNQWIQRIKPLLNMFMAKFFVDWDLLVKEKINVYQKIQVRFNMRNRFLNIRCCIGSVIFTTFERMYSGLE